MDSDIEAGNGASKTPSSSDAPPAYDAPRDGGSSARRDASPLPAPVPQKPAPIPRESLDGDTMFAVDDSDDESEDERQRLTSGKPS